MTFQSAQPCDIPINSFHPSRSTKHIISPQPYSHMCLPNMIFKSSQVFPLTFTIITNIQSTLQHITIPPYLTACPKANTYITSFTVYQFYSTECSQYISPNPHRSFLFLSPSSPTSNQLFNTPPYLLASMPTPTSHLSLSITSTPQSAHNTSLQILKFPISFSLKHHTTPLHKSESTS